MSFRAVAIVLLVLAPWARIAAADPPGATLETGGVTIWYEVRGSGTGTPLIVANGGPGFDHDYLLCGDVWDTLAKGRRIVFYDQRGNGRSSELTDGQPCGLAEQIDDLEALRAHLGFEKLDLLGHSWGGYLVMAYAARHPEHIAHLMIVDSAAPKIQDTVFLFKNIYPETTTREDALAFAVELGDQKAVAADLHEYMSMLFYTPQARDAFLARSSAFVYRQKVNKAVWDDLQRFDLNPEPDYCYHCEGRHCFQRHRASSQALVPPDTQQHSAILVHQVRRIYDHTVWVTANGGKRTSGAQPRPAASRVQSIILRQKGEM